MNLIEQAVLFWKMANLGADFAYSKDEKGYKYLIGRLSIDLTKFGDIIQAIKEFQGEPYFHIQDFLNPSFRWLQFLLRGAPRDFEYMAKDLFRRGIDPTSIEAIITFGVTHFLERSSLVSSDYIDLEKLETYIPTELMHKAQRKVVLNLINQFRALEPLERMPETTEQEIELKRKKKDAAKKDLLERLNGLIDNSTKLPKHFIDELVKKFGLDFYLDWTEKRHYSPPPKYGKLDVYDVAKKVKETNLHKEELLSLFNRGDEQAREYLRGLVYMGPSSEFILDSENEPMDINLKHIRWPSVFMAYRPSKKLRQSSDDMKNYWAKWIQIINDFRVIPQ